MYTYIYIYTYVYICIHMPLPHLMLSFHPSDSNLRLQRRARQSDPGLLTPPVRSTRIRQSLPWNCS